MNRSLGSGEVGRASGARQGQRRGSPPRPARIIRYSGVHAAMPLMRLGHVFLHGVECPHPVCRGVYGQQRVVIVEGPRPCDGQPDGDLLAIRRMRHE